MVLRDQAKSHLKERLSARQRKARQQRAEAVDLGRLAGRLHCESAWKIDPLTGDIGVQK